MGTDDDSPPEPTETTITCTDGLIWSEDLQKCVAPQESSLSDDQRYQAARELAYAGLYSEALGVLAAMSDPTDDRVLTYKGFVHRNLGDTRLADAYYRLAIAVNPDNLLARSYMAQGFVARGRWKEARAQLTEIRARGGHGTWAEAALKIALHTGRVSAY